MKKPRRKLMSDGLGPKKSVSFPLDVHKMIENRMAVACKTYVEVVREIVCRAVRKPFE